MCQAESHSSSLFDTPELQHCGQELHSCDLDQTPSHSNVKTEEWIDDVESFTQMNKPYQDCLMKKLNEAMTEEEWIEDVVETLTQMNKPYQDCLMKKTE